MIAKTQNTFIFVVRLIMFNVCFNNISGPSTTNGHAKAKTPQQRAGETMLKHILQEVEGECYSFR
jgi:hypothetical protein